MSLEIVKLGDVAETSSGGTPNRSVNEYWKDGFIPWIKSGQLKDCVITEVEEFITDVGLKNSSAKIFRKGTLLLALYGATAGKLGFLGLDAATNQAICSIVPKSNSLVKEYLYYYLLSIRKKIISDSAGGAQPNISQNYVRELRVPLPKVSIQQKIIAVLDRAVDLHKKDQLLLHKYDELAQSIFIDMFGDPNKNDKGWNISILKECTTKIGSGATPTGGKTAYKKSGVSLIRSMNVYDYAFKWKDLAYIDDVQAEKLKNVEVFSNDVLFNITGASVCRCSIVPNEVLPARVNQHVSIIRSDTVKLNPLFLNHLLVSDSMKRKLLHVGSAGGAVMEAITKDQLENLEIILPPVSLQNDFAERINLLWLMKKKEEVNLRSSDTLFNSLIQEAFKGELFS